MRGGSGGWAHRLRLREVSGLSGETVPASGLAIRSGWYPAIRSTSLTAAPEGGSVVYNAQGAGAEAGLAFAGTFGGGNGGYGCSGSACSVTLDDRGAPTAMAGSWFFEPAAGAEVRVPDYDHLYFGWWLDADEDAYGFQSFAGAAGFAPGAVAAAMEGSATYRGVAAGVWTTVDSSGGRITSARAGEFTAEATLRANFFGASDAGVVNGEIPGSPERGGRRCRTAPRGTGISGDRLRRSPRGARDGLSGSPGTRRGGWRVLPRFAGD